MIQLKFKLSVILCHILQQLFNSETIQSNQLNQRNITTAIQMLQLSQRATQRATLSSFTRLLPTSRMGFTAQPGGAGRPNIIQEMPSYQAALKAATEEKYDDALNSLQDAIRDVEAQVGENTKFHLFLYQRVASLQMLTKDLPAVEDTFKKCIEVAEGSTVSLNPKADQTQNVFMWQNNLLKFYLEHDMAKAIDLSRELLDDLGNILPAADVADLKFSLATAYALDGQDIDASQAAFKECLDTSSPMMKGYVHNNLGMTHFYKFVALSSEIGDPQGAGLDAVQPVIAAFEAAVLNLKSSIRAFEQLDSKYKEIESEAAEGESQQQTVMMSLVKQKLFTDEFFSLEPPGEILPQAIKHYDLKANAANEQLLQQAFTVPASILPIQNLGEIAFIMQKYRDGFALLDMSLKMYKLFDGHNLLKFKCMTMLGSLLESQGDTLSMQRIHEAVFRQLDKVDCYEKVFATRNYGYLLAKHDATRLEGQDQIKKAEQMQQGFPYWSERRMGLFVPTMQALDETQFNI